MAFKLKNSLYKSSQQQAPEEETKEVPREFINFSRSDDSYKNKKSETAKQGHSKIFYSSGFKLE